MDTFLLLLTALASLRAAFVAARSAQTMADDLALKRRPYILYSGFKARSDRILIYFKNHGQGVGRLLRIRASSGWRIEIDTPLWIGHGEEGKIAVFRNGLGLVPDKDITLNLSLYVMDMNRRIYRDELGITLRQTAAKTDCFQVGEFFHHVKESVPATFEPVHWPESPATMLTIQEWWEDRRLETESGSNSPD